MKVSRVQAAEHRERILDVAAQLFRERGFDGIGVADLMQHAGLTHGGFYGHFSSKEDLVAQACARVLATTLERWTETAARAPGDPLAAIAASYLSALHRDRPGSGCLLAAVGTDVSRQPPSVRGTVTQGLRAIIEALTRLVPGKSALARREKALAAFASLVGALVLARAVDDRDLSEDILRAVSGALS